MTDRELQASTLPGKAARGRPAGGRRARPALAAAVVVGGVALCALSLIALPRRRPRRRWRLLDPRNEGRWDKVDEASYDSFPASDPPGFYSGAVDLH